MCELLVFVYIWDLEILFRISVILGGHIATLKNSLLQ